MANEESPTNAAKDSHRNDVDAAPPAVGVDLEFARKTLQFAFSILDRAGSLCSLDKWPEFSEENVILPLLQRFPQLAAETFTVGSNGKAKFPLFILAELE